MRPINPLEKQAEVIAAIRYVDCVVAFEESTPLEVLRRLVPHALIKGADYAEDAVVGADIVKRNGGAHLSGATNGGSVDLGHRPPDSWYEGDGLMPAIDLFGPAENSDRVELIGTSPLRAGLRQKAIIV
jgi:hypothetical protein